MTVRVRFAPSPTGYLHIGGARTALFNWMFARRHGGQFIVRIEDTDQKRYVEGATQYILDSLAWLGLEWDEGPDKGGPFGPYIQSERVDIYRKWADWLLANGGAYECFCTGDELAFRRQQKDEKKGHFGYDRRCRDLAATEVLARKEAGDAYVIRFKMDLTGETTIHDAIRGDITYNNNQIDDAVLLKSDKFPTYHLANVIDDHLMEISHIMRADEWINSAPLHIALYNAFGWKPPIYAHLSLILNPDGKGKLSKRTQSFQADGEQVLVKVAEFQEAGYLPEAVVNFLSNVGWAFGDDREIFGIDEAVERFELDQINPAPARLPYSKLDWLNGQYIQKMSPEALAEAILPYLIKAGWAVKLEQLLLVVPSLTTRLKRFPEALPFLQFIFEEKPLELTVEQLIDKKLPLEQARIGYQEALLFVRQTDSFEIETIKAKMFEIGEKVTTNGKAGPFLGRLRLGISGQQVSPPLFESMLALGQERSIRRLEEIITLING